MLLESNRQNSMNLCEAYTPVVIPVEEHGRTMAMEQFASQFCSCGLGLTHMNVDDTGLRMRQISINLSMGLLSGKIRQWWRKAAQLQCFPI